MYVHIQIHKVQVSCDSCHAQYVRMCECTEYATHTHTVHMYVRIHTYVLLQESTALEIIGHFEGHPADLVVCDGAPDGMFVCCMDIYILSTRQQIPCQQTKLNCQVMFKGPTLLVQNVKLILI